MYHTFKYGTKCLPGGDGKEDILGKRKGVAVNVNLTKMGDPVV